MRVQWIDEPEISVFSFCPKFRVVGGHVALLKHSVTTTVNSISAAKRILNSWFCRSVVLNQQINTGTLVQETMEMVFPANHLPVMSMLIIILYSADRRVMNHLYCAVCTQW